MKVLAIVLFAFAMTQEVPSSKGSQFLGTYKLYNLKYGLNESSSYYSLCKNRVEITQAGPNGIRVGKTDALILDGEDRNGVVSTISEDGKTIWNHDFNKKILERYTIDDEFLPSPCTVSYRRLDYTDTASVGVKVKKYVRIGCDVELDNVLFG